MPRFRRSVGTAGVLALAVLALTPSAHAEVILHEKFADSFSDDFELCGIPVHTEFEFSGVTHLRVGKGDQDSAFFLLLRIRTTETITNPANGQFLVIEGNSLQHDTKATPVAGSVFRFTSVEAGQPFVLRDMTGAVLLRDRGVIRTDDPVRHARGRHPGRCDLGGARCESGRTPSRVLHGRGWLLRPCSGPHRLNAPARPCAHRSVHTPGRWPWRRPNGGRRLSRSPASARTRKVGRSRGRAGSAGQLRRSRRRGRR